MLECRVRAVRSDNQYVLRRYDEFFFAENVLLAEVDAAVIERATRLRAGYAFRTPDAIHLATAIDTSSDVFLTRDNRLLQCKEITVQLVP